MTKSEAHKSMEAGHKVRRTYFDPEEYIYIDLDTGIIMSEDGYDFTDWWDNIEPEIPTEEKDCWSIYKEEE